MKKRMITMLLALAMLAGTMVSCGSEEVADPEETTVGTEIQETETETETETVFEDGLPDVDCEGKVYRMALGEESAYELDTGELTGNIESDVLFERNAKISERFNMEFEAVSYAGGDPVKTYKAIVQAVTAGDPVADTASLEVWQFYTAVSGGIYRNWLETEYIQFDKPWWNQEIHEGSTFNGKLLGLMGDYTLTYLLSLNAIFFNPVLLNDYSIPLEDLYTTVREGRWTIDKLSEMVSGMYQDTNGNGERDMEDIYGYSAPYSSRLDVYPAAFEITLSGHDENGYLIMEPLSEKVHTALEKVCALFYTNQGGLMFPDKDMGLGAMDYFAGSQIVFMNGGLNDAMSTYRDMEDSFGILPIPKYDEAQKNYHSLVNDGCCILGLLKTTTDTEFVSLITDALCAESYNSVYPAYYEVVLKSKYSLDENVAEMIDYVVQGASFDVTFMYGVYLNMLPYQFRICVMTNNTDLASKYASLQKSVEKKIEELNKMYE